MDYISHNYSILRYTFVALCLVIFVFLKKFLPSLFEKPSYYNIKSRTGHTIYTTNNLTECAQILAGKSLNGNVNILSKYEARALANTQIRHAFGIDNAFTTEKVERHREYRNEVGTLLAPDWKMVAHDAKKLAESFQCPQNFVVMVQSFVLKMTIHVLFQRDLSVLDDRCVSLVAAEINHIWIDSKSPRHTISWAAQHRVHDALHRLIPDRDPLDPQTNAMNLILPAFETMWRIVLRCFMEVRFRGADDTKEWKAALKTFLENPDAKQSEALEEREGIAVAMALVREALRLYPPTRHVYRHFRFEDSSSVLAVANIQGLHRDTEIWGTDADCFRPSRWLNITPESEQFKAWMPFGGSPFICPAKTEFGPKMIGILVAALVETFSSDKYQLRVEGLQGQVESAKFDGPLSCGRGSYGELFLEEDAPCGDCFLSTVHDKEQGELLAGSVEICS